MQVSLTKANKGLLSDNDYFCWMKLLRVVMHNSPVVKFYDVVKYKQKLEIRMINQFDYPFNIL